MITAIAERPTLDPRVIEQVLLAGDLSKLTPDQRLSYYNRVCESLGLNPLTQPFAYLKLGGREILYAKKDATEQLRMIHHISIDPAGFTREVIEGVYIVTAPASTPSGRTDVSTGAVAIEGLKGENRANAMMKAETKAKRRVTLSICGLGMLDETEIDTIPRDPQYTVEAPSRVELPAGTVQILSVVPKRKGQAEWADVTYVDALGVESTAPTTVEGNGAPAKLFEQLAQEACPVRLTLKVTPRSKRTVIAEVHRWTPPQQAETSALGETAITADQIPF
jgi:hypothetical protein